MLSEKRKAMDTTTCPFVTVVSLAPGGTYTVRVVATPSPGLCGRTLGKPADADHADRDRDRDDDGSK